MIDTAIYQLIQSKQPITDLVGTNVSPLTRKDRDSFPFVTYEQVSSPRQYNDSGQVAVIDSFWDLNCYARTYGEVTQVANVLADNLAQSSGTFGSIEIRYVEVVDMGTDDYLEEIEIYTKRIEIKLTYTLVL